MTARVRRQSLLRLPDDAANDKLSATHAAEGYSHLSARRCCLGCSQARIVAAAASMWFIKRRPGVCLACLLLAHSLEVIGSWLARRAHAAADEMIAAMDTLSDRLVVIATTAALAYAQPDYAAVFATMLLLDQASSWLQAAAGGCCGHDLYRDVEFAALLEARAPAALVAISAGSEAFLLLLYSHATGLLAPEHATAAALGTATASTATALSWHELQRSPLLLLLAACCAVRQLLALLQILTSISRIGESMLMQASTSTVKLAPRTASKGKRRAST